MDQKKPIMLLNSTRYCCGTKLRLMNDAKGQILLELENLSVEKCCATTMNKWSMIIERTYQFLMSVGKRSLCRREGSSCNLFSKTDITVKKRELTVGANTIWSMTTRITGLRSTSRCRTVRQRSFVAILSDEETEDCFPSSIRKMSEFVIRSSVWNQK